MRLMAIALAALLSGCAGSSPDGAAAGAQGLLAATPGEGNATGGWVLDQTLSLSFDGHDATRACVPAGANACMGLLAEDDEMWEQAVGQDVRLVTDLQVDWEDRDGIGPERLFRMTGLERRDGVTYSAGSIEANGTSPLAFAQEFYLTGEASTIELRLWDPQQVQQGPVYMYAHEGTDYRISGTIDVYTWQD